MSSELADRAAGGQRTHGTGTAIDGVRASSLAQPGSIEQLAEVMRGSEADGSTIGVMGAATAIGTGNPPEALDLLVQTRALDRVVEHAAGDLVVTVEAGVRLADLQTELAGSRQWLALDPPHPDATVGGIVAAAASGPRRLRWGTPRDLLIGITVVLADGTVARSGGKVVKNVAGYDLGKLFVGSYGSLGVIAKCTFRLHPRPPVLRAVSIALDGPAAVAEAAAAVSAARVQPSAAEWDGERLTVVVEGSERVCETGAERVAGALGGARVATVLPEGFGGLPWDRRTTDPVAGAGISGRSGTSGGSTPPVGLKLTHRLGALRAALDAVGRVEPGAGATAHVGSGVVWIAPAGGRLDGLEDLRREAAALDGQVTVVEAPPETKRGVDVWGPVRGFEVMRRVKERFDPERRMSPGRFVGGL